MGQKLENTNTFMFNDEVTNYFNIEIAEQIRNNDYDLLKKDIYNLDIDCEEKANIINNISKLSVATTQKERKDLIQQIENFKKKYKI